jgi:ariadne-1
MSAGDGDWFDDFDDSDAGDELSQEGSPYATDSDAGAAALAGEASPTPTQQQRGRLYAVVDRPTLAALQREAMDQVSAILGCDAGTARALLIHFSWDAESVLCTIAERGQEEVYKRAGLLSRAPPAAPPAPARAASRRLMTCGVCMCDVPAAAGEAMACGHAFCRDCWAQHLGMGVEEGLGRRLRCMAPGCGLVCGEDEVRRLLAGAPAARDKYESALLGERSSRRRLRAPALRPLCRRLPGVVFAAGSARRWPAPTCEPLWLSPPSPPPAAESYVDDNKRVKWCPSAPHCGHAVRVPGDPHCDVECACGQRFCFACTEAPHSPATCEM